MQSLEAFVLIGGRSSRMGTDKALLKINGETFVQRAVNTIQTAFPHIKISLVARDENQFSTDHLPRDIPVVYDIHKDRGAYSGLHSALSSAKSEWVFVLACDIPFVSVDLLKFMMELIDGVFDAIVNVTPDGRVQPLCAFYRVENCLARIGKSLAAEGKLPPLANVFESLRTKSLGFADIDHLPGAEKFLHNINSPDDLNRIA